jgi:hypothetical protein
MKKFFDLPRICSLPNWSSPLLMVSALLLIAAGVLGLGV